MKIPANEARLDKTFEEAFDVNHPAMHDWVKIKFELRKFREAPRTTCAIVDMICSDCREECSEAEH